MSIIRMLLYLLIWNVICGVLFINDPTPHKIALFLGSFAIGVFCGFRTVKEKEK